MDERPSHQMMLGRVLDHKCPWCGGAGWMESTGVREGRGEYVWVEWNCLDCESIWEERFVRPETNLFRICHEGVDNAS